MSERRGDERKLGTARSGQLRLTALLKPANMGDQVARSKTDLTCSQGSLKTVVLW